MTQSAEVAGDRRVRHTLALAAIVFLALATRLYDLSGESIWTDEAYSIQMARRPAAEIVAVTARDDTTPPLYYLSLHVWWLVFGDSPGAMRMPSVILGTLGVFFTYLAAAPLMGRRGGLVAALIHALSPFHVAYSQEVRQYALLSCASIASFAFLVRLSENRRFATPAYVAATILMCYAHSVGSFVLLAQTVFVTGFAFLTKSLPWRRILVAQAAAAAAFLPWVIFMIGQYRLLNEGFWVPVPTVYSFIETFYEYVASMLLVQLFLLLGLLGLVQLTPTGGPLSWRNPIGSFEQKTWILRPADLKATWLLLCWLVIPIAALFVISRIGTPIYLTRATIAASSAFYLLAARGVMQLRGLLHVAVVIVVGMLLFREVVGYYRATTKEEWNVVARDISPLIQVNDVFVFHQRARQLAFDYYVTRDDVRRVPFPDRYIRDTETVTEKDMQAFPGWVDDSARVWLILGYSKDERDLIKNHLLRTRQVVFHRKYRFLEVQAFESKPR